jgi:pimeloyl-ACP methyl ester carboxylesterase
MTPPRPLAVPSNRRELFGMLHEPDGPSAAFGVIFCNAGPQNRVGPQRIYVHAARRFASAGLTCLRLDLPGVGESAGPFPENHLDCHDPANVRGAVDLLLARGLTGVAVLGLCVGARVAARATLADPRIDGAVCWSAPVISGAPDILASAISQAAARGQLKRWGERLRQPGRWGRYFTSRDARREAVVKLRHVAATLLRRGDDDVLPRFVHEMETLLRSPRPVFVAYGERDVGPRAEFEAHLAPFVAGPHPDRRLFLVPGGDHTYAAVAARDRVIEETLAWLLGRARAR